MLALGAVVLRAEGKTARATSPAAVSRATARVSRQPAAPAVWHVSASAGVFGGGTSARPFRRIQDGLDRAAPGDVVLVADGTYTGAGNKNLDFKGKAVTLRSQNGRDRTTIDCEGFGRAFYLHSGEGVGTVVQGFTITGANTGVVSSVTASNTAQDVIQYGLTGSAIFCTRSSGLSLLDSVVENSQAMTYEVVTYVETPVTSGSVVDADGSGGAIYCNGGQLYCSNVVVRNNRAGMHGGAISVENGAEARIVHSQISGNVSAIARTSLFTSIATPVTTIYMREISGEGAGGGIHCAASVLDIEDCLISGNASVRAGGGISAEATGRLNVLRCNVASNVLDGTVAGVGGGGIHASRTRTEVVDSTIAGNECRLPDEVMATTIVTPVSVIVTVESHAAGRGGAMLVTNTVLVRIAGCRIEGNAAGTGGGIVADQVKALLLSRDNFFQNSAQEGGAMSLRESTCAMRGSEFGHNAVWGQTNTTITTTINTPFSQIITVESHLDGTGGAICMDYSRIEAARIVFNANHAYSAGGAVAVRSGSSLALRDFLASGNECLGASMNSSISTHLPTFTDVEARSSQGSGAGTVFFCDDSSLLLCRGEIADNGPGSTTIHLTRNASVEMDSVLVAANTGGLSLSNSYQVLPDETVTNISQGSTAAGRGVGLFMDSGKATLSGTTFYRNRGTPGEDGIYAAALAQLDIRNSIVWSNALAFRPVSRVTAQYSFIEGGFAGTGNIAANPLLTPAGRLRSGSPAINAGNSQQNPLLDFENEPRNQSPSGRPGAPDIGADEFIDADNDKMSDAWEILHFGDTRVSDGRGDADRDGLYDLFEYNYSTDPNDPDSDGDTRSDGWEVLHGNDPLSRFD